MPGQSAYSPITAITASLLGTTTVGSKPAVLIAVSGSFNPCPVIVAAMRLPSPIIPLSTHFFIPARHAADAGSTRIPSVRASIV